MMTKRYMRKEQFNSAVVNVTYTYDELRRQVGEDEVDQFIQDGGFIEINDLSMDPYQSDTEQTAKYPKDHALEYLALGIASEAGEVAGKMKKWIRDTNSKTREQWVTEISSEVGDVLWYCARLSDELGVPLSLIAEENMNKLLDRKARGVIGGSGDNR